MAAKSSRTTSSSNATLRTDRGATPRFRSVWLRSEWLPALGLAIGLTGVRGGWLEPRHAVPLYTTFGIAAIFLGFKTLIGWFFRGTDAAFRFKDAFALMTAVAFCAGTASHRIEERQGREPASAHSVRLLLPIEDAFTWAQAAALEEDWTVTRSDREDSTIDAFALSPIFKVREDFVIEVDRRRGGLGGAEVTVRGRNPRLIRRYLDTLARRRPGT